MLNISCNLRYEWIEITTRKAVLFLDPNVLLVDAKSSLRFFLDFIQRIM